MSKKTFTIFTLFLLAIIAFLGWFFFLRTTGPTLPNDPNRPTDLFPFDQGTSTQQGTQGTGTGSSTDQIDLSNNQTVELPSLRQLWKEPVAGAIFYPGTGTTTAVRFVDRATGHIYQSPLSVTGESKVSNITIPQIHEALWASNANELILRYLKDDSTTIQSFYAMIGTSTASTTSSVEGYFLPTNIRDIAVAGDSILYFNPAVQIGSLVQSRIDGTGRRVVMSAEARDWSLSYTNQKTAFIGTRPSGLVKGFGYALNLTTGATTKIAGDISGLTGTINPQGTWAIMSAQDGTGFVTGSYDIKKNVTDRVSVDTLSDKCVWSNVSETLIYCAVPTTISSGTYPDDWYSGKVSFSDKLWSIDLATGEATIVMDPSFESTQEMDIMSMTVQKNDEFITFINKKDLSLWLYRLDNIDDIVLTE